MKFSDQLKAARKAAALNQAQAAAAIGIGKRSFCDWEAGNVIPHPYMREASLRDIKLAGKRGTPKQSNP